MVEATITDVQPVGEETIAVDVETRRPFEGQPGQFVLVRVSIDDGVETAHYTISSPEVTDRFELTVGIDSEGTLGPWLQSASPGDVIELEGPFGDTYFESEDRISILAQGPGIGPAVGVGEQAVRAGSDLAIYYLNETLPHAERLEALGEAGATVSHSTDVEEFTDAVIDGLGEEQVYVFGFSWFIDAVEEVLEDTASPLPSPKIEDFGPS